MSKICNLFRRLCKPKKQELSFFEAIKLEKFEDLRKTTPTQEELNTALLEAVKNKNTTLVEILIEKGASNLNEGLKQACIENSYAVAEIFAKSGKANIPFGIAYAKSTNILSMLLRYKQKSELIK